ncbi:D-alanyl-D-alanine dipeptidase [Vibrio coralliilyticus]|nr:D-alanyl-D-alanine dipeptidase [Vibrio coralliilyticus]
MKHLPLTDKRIQQIRVIDNKEAIKSLDLNDSKLVLDYDMDLGYTNQFVARESVVQRLKLASNFLPNGFYLSVKETYRPKSFQSFIYNRRMINLLIDPDYRDLTICKLREKASEFIAPPEVAGHPTGGAVDVSLVNEQGDEVDLGCKYDQDSTESEGRCYSFAMNLSKASHQNRQILFECMEKAGFVNYPFEWWHWSYGDKYWAAITKAPNALFSAIELR